MSSNASRGLDRRNFLRVAGAGVAGLHLFGIAGCSSDATSSPEGKSGVIEIAATADPPSLDWTISEASATTQVAYHIFEQLFALDEKMTVRPMLATGFETSDDLLEYTIGLREGVPFHDGGTMTSADVIASLNRWGRLSSLGATAFAQVKDVRAVDDLQIKITLKSPYTPLIDSLAAPSLAMMVLPADVVEAAGDSPLKNSQLIGTGPFTFDSWQRGQRITITPFAGYASRDEDWGGLTGRKKATAKKVNFTIVAEPETRMSGLLTGKYHYTDRVPKDSYERVESADNLEPEESNLNSYLALGFNKSTGPFTDIRMRRAVNHALNKEEIALAVYGSEEFFKLDGSIFLPDQTKLYTTEGTDAYDVYDPDEAKRLMDEAGYNGEPITMIGTSTYDDHHMSAQVESQQLADAGFNIDLQSYEWATYLERVSDPANFDLFYTGYPAVWDPTAVLWFAPDHPGWWKSPRIAKLLKKWTSTTDDDVRQSLLVDMNRLLYEDLPILKICNEVGLGAVSTSLEGYKSWLDIRTWNAWVSAGASDSSGY